MMRKIAITEQLRPDHMVLNGLQEMSMDGPRFLVEEDVFNATAIKSCAHKCQSDVNLTALEARTHKS